MLLFLISTVIALFILFILYALCYLSDYMYNIINLLL